MGRAAAFSFYPGKNLGACGDAGAITTNDEKLACKIRMLRDHGQAKKYYHDIEGYNGRLDAIQAGMLSVKLKHLPTWNAQRRAAARRYNDLFTNAFAALNNSITQQPNNAYSARCPLPAASLSSPSAAGCRLLVAGRIALPHEPGWSKAVYHLYVIRIQDRAELQARLASVGIGTGIHYPIPLHLQKAYDSLNYRSGDFPVCEKIAAEILSLPMFPTLTAEQQARVVDAILPFVRD